MPLPSTQNIGQIIDLELSRIFQSCVLKVVDSCRTFSKTGFDTFRSILIYGKEQESRKKKFITVQKNSSS